MLQGQEGVSLAQHLLGVLRIAGVRGGEGRRDCHLYIPCLALPKPGQGLLYHSRGAQVPESLLHSCGVALRLPRDLSCLLTGSVQAQPPKFLYNQLSPGGDGGLPT